MSALKGTKTEKNLLAAFAGESQARNRYLFTAKTAKNEGLPEIATLFQAVVKVEQAHEARYKKLLKNIQNNTVFKKEKAVKWKCRKCGYIHEGKEALNIYPACSHTKAHFELFVENY